MITMLWLTKNFFDQPVKNDLRTYDNIWTFATGQGNDYATGFILDFVYFKYYYKLIVIGINKRNWCYPQLNQQLNCWFTGNLEEDGNATIFFHYWRSESNYFEFFRRNRESIAILFCFNIKWLNIKLYVTL